MKVPNKGGFAEWGPKEIYITSNKHVWEWYKEELDPQPIMGRVEKYLVFYNNEFIDLSDSRLACLTHYKYNF